MAQDKRAVIVVDVQRDFCEGGSLEVPGGAAAAAAITALIAQRGGRDLVVATRDMHIDPGAHFAKGGAQPDYVNSWPAHCVAGTPGAEYHPNLTITPDIEVHKGAHAAAYSGFEGRTADGEELADVLRRRGITHLDICGIATDYCVRATALDALGAGFSVRLLTDLCAAVDAAGGAAAIEELRRAGVEIASSRNASLEGH